MGLVVVGVARWRGGIGIGIRMDMTKEGKQSRKNCA
jgi:hypothetical protein